MHNDPKYTQVSASLRKGILYVKMGKDTAIQLVGYMENATIDIATKNVEMGRAIVFHDSAKEWEKDLEILKKVSRTLDPANYIGRFASAIELGLARDPSVDWIARVEAQEELLSL